MNTLYSQHMKHHRNHRKDKYYQQCSGYYGKSYEEYLKEKEYNEAVVGYGIIEISTGNLINRFDSWDAAFEYGKRYKQDQDKMLIYIRRSGEYYLSGKTSIIYGIS